MFDDSNLRKRFRNNDMILPLTQHDSAAAASSVRPFKGKRRKRRSYWKSILWNGCAGTCATLVSATLSVIFLPTTWFQVDYKHQVQRAATQMWKNRLLLQQNHGPKQRFQTHAELESIRCTDGTIGWMNDNYCDCPDGRDEPTTSACSHILIQSPTFACTDNDGNPILIFASRLRDGIMDCSDGSDER